MRIANDYDDEDDDDKNDKEYLFVDLETDLATLLVNARDVVVERCAPYLRSFTITSSSDFPFFNFKRAIFFLHKS